MTNEEVKEAYKATRRRARIMLVVGLLAAFGLPVLARVVTASMGIALPGMAGLGILLAVFGVMAVAGFRIGRCPACNAYIGTEPLHKWGQPRKCRRCGVALD